MVAAWLSQQKAVNERIESRSREYQRFMDKQRDGVFPALPQKHSSRNPYVSHRCVMEYATQVRREAQRSCEVKCKVALLWDLPSSSKSITWIAYSAYKDGYFGWMLSGARKDRGSTSSRRYKTANPRVSGQDEDLKLCDEPRVQDAVAVAVVKCLASAFSTCSSYYMRVLPSVLGYAFHCSRPRRLRL